MPKVTKDKEAMQKRGEILLLLRKSRGIKQSTIADILGISQQAYLKYEHGDADPTIDALLKLSDFYHVSIDFLLGTTSKATPLLDIPTKPVDDDEFVRLYESLPDFAKEVFVEVLAKLAQAQKDRTKRGSIRATPEQAEEQESKPDIQLHEGQRLAVARTDDLDKLYRPAPTEEQMKSFTPCTPDMLGEDE